MTVAADAGGCASVEPWIDAAKQTHLSLLDPDLEIANLYGVRNVPSAFWIDETGHIVRAHDPIYAQRNEAYLDAVREWVTKGAASKFQQDEQALEKRGRAPSFADVEAGASFDLGVYLARRGDVAAAQKHFDRARELAPDNWTYRRQAWKFAGAATQTIVDAIQDPEAPPFYPDLDLPN